MIISSHNIPIGIISHIYKNKVCNLDINNYRGITILTCFGKLFTCTLNKLNLSVETNGVLGNEQVGFRIMINGECLVKLLGYSYWSQTRGKFISNFVLIVF